MTVRSALSGEDTAVDGDQGGNCTTTNAHDSSGTGEPSAGPLGPVQMRKVKKIITTGVRPLYPLTEGSSTYSQALMKQRLNLSRMICLLDRDAVVIPHNRQTDQQT